MNLDQALQRAESAKAQQQRPARQRPTHEERRQDSANEAAATLVMLLENSPWDASAESMEVRTIRHLEWLAKRGVRPIASDVDAIVEKWERQMAKAESVEATA